MKRWADDIDPHQAYNDDDDDDDMDGSLVKNTTKSEKIVSY